MLAISVLVCDFSHLRLPQRKGNAIDAYFYACPKTLRLEVVLRSKFPGTIGDY